MAALTVIDARGTLTRDVGEFAALADLDAAMAYASRQCGLEPASDVRLVDDDLVGLATADRDMFYDVSRLAAWRSILGNATETGLRDVGIDESPSSVRDLARDQIKDLAARVKSVYGVGLSRLGVNTIGLDFQAGADTYYDCA
jgi:hypothetical protein